MAVQVVARGGVGENEESKEDSAITYESTPLLLCPSSIVELSDMTHHSSISALVG